MKAFYFTLFYFLFVATVWCQTQLVETNQDDRYYAQVLERKIELMSDSMYSIDRKLTTSKIVMLSENAKKKAWIKVLAAETAIITGAILAITTGAFVPVCMGVLAFEIYLLVEGNYRLNTKKIKKLRRSTGKELETYLN